MANHPYISGVGNITQMIGYLRKNFPATVTSETVKKYGLASNNESYVINALQFIGLIDEDGNRTEVGHEVLTTHDEAEFGTKFSDLIMNAYKDLFALYGEEETWALPRPKLIGYFRQADKTSEIIGTRQAAVFQALRSIAGHEVLAESKAPAATKAPKTRAAATKVPKSKAAEAATVAAQTLSTPGKVPTKPGMALTVRIEINLPSEGSQETYDAIFKSIKANLYP